MFLAQLVTVFIVGDLNADTSLAFAGDGVGDMSNTVFMIGIVMLTSTQQAVHPALVLILLLIGIFADVFTFIKLR